MKTTLTAIITYVNLLKQENVTEEERRSYIQLLDQKSMRLNARRPFSSHRRWGY